MREAASRSAPRTILTAGLALWGAFWFLDAAVGSLLFPHETFLTLLAPTEAGLAVRVLVLAVLAAYAILHKDLLERADRARRIAEERAARFRALFEGSPDAILAIDPDTLRPIEFSDGAAALLGCTRDEFAALDVSDWIASGSRDEVRARLAEAAERGGAEFETRLKTKSGSLLDARLCLRRAEIDGRSALSAAIRDMSAHADAERRLDLEAGRDPLVGLYSRRRFLEHLGASAAFADRRGISLTLCLCDLDGFRAINREHGRVVGDRALASLGDAVRREIRREDAAGRYGDDEVCILFQGAAAAESEACIERIRARLAETILHGEGGRAFTLAATFGMAEHRAGMSIQEFVDAAEKALRTAKEAAAHESWDLAA